MKTFTEIKKEVADGKNAWDAINEAQLTDTGAKIALMNALYQIIELEEKLISKP